MATRADSRPTLIGQSVPRKENYALLTGAARFVDDITREGMLHARILRSRTAHARIVSVDTAQARSLPGVHDVITGSDLTGRVARFGSIPKGLPYDDRVALADDKVVFEGQELAAVAAETPHQAQDALDAISVRYEQLPTVVDPERALAADAPRIWDFTDGNVWDRYRLDVGDVDAADAQVVVRQRFTTNRPAAVALEPHGCVAEFDGERLTLYTSTQFTHLLKDILSSVIGLPVSRIRVVTPHVGGSFGSKGDAFPHEIVVSLLAIRTRRPVKLILGRAEVFRAVGGRCGQVRDAELRVAADGTIVGYRDNVINNSGAVSPFGGQIMRIGMHIGVLPYPIPNLALDGATVATNTSPAGPVRGFGVPQTLWAKEQLVDMAAEELGMDPVQLRLKNIPTSDECPYQTPAGHRIDTSTAHECLEKVAEAIGWQTHRRTREPYVGVGVAVGMKYTSARHPSIDTDLSTIRISVGMDGHVTVRSGDVPHGQGHETFLSQVVGDELGVGFDQVEVITADTDATPFSLGTFGSRSAALLSTAATRACAIVRERIELIAGQMLGARPDELELANGMVSVATDPERALPLAAIAGTAVYMTNSLPDTVPAGPLEAQATYDTPTELERADGGGDWAATYSAGAHAARVRVDPDTGHYEILDYVMAHDSGTVINPLIVEGQHHGGFVHGFGMVFGEDYHFDADGHLLNASLAHYLAPVASDVPNLHRSYEVGVASTTIPGGQKGAGETSTAPVPPAIGNALADAIGVRFCRLPITPEDVVLALAEKQRRGVDRLIWPDFAEERTQR